LRARDTKFLIELSHSEQAAKEQAGQNRTDLTVSRAANQLRFANSGSDTWPNPVQQAGAK